MTRLCSLFPPGSHFQQNQDSEFHKSGVDFLLGGATDWLQSTVLIRPFWTSSGGLEAKQNRAKPTLTEATSGQRLFGRAEAQLPTHHGGGQEVPLVVAYGSPLPVFQDLHAALADDGPAPETHQRLLGVEMETEVHSQSSRFMFH